jgi:hypothetical protein
MGFKETSEIGLMAGEALDADVTRIAQHQLRMHGYDSASSRVADALTGFVIRVQGGEIRIRSHLEFLPTLQLINSKTEV